MTRLAARLGALTNTVHGFIYFADEAASAYAAVGLEPSMQYFPSRAAPLGPVGPELVVATFFNFCPDAVRAVVPDCWDIATPERVQQARMKAAGDVLRRACIDTDAATIAEITELATRIVDRIGDEGKPLAAANRAVALPDDPWIALWQQITVLREWRGDAHVAALTANAVGAVEALVLHAATGGVSRSALQRTRGWSDDEWHRGVQSLAARGLVDTSGAATPNGTAFRNDIEEQTNRASQPLVDAIGAEAAQRLGDLLKPIASALLASGVFAPLLAAQQADR